MRIDLRRPKSRRLIYALIPTVALLALATAVLSTLERRQVIKTERRDDLATHAPLQLLHVVRLNGEDFYEINNPQMKRSRFPVKKAPGTFRVVLLGGSFMMGSPYVTQGSLDQNVHGDIGHWLDAMLQIRFPRERFEIINAGAGGGNSNVIRENLAALLTVEPDLFVIACGNNEAYLVTDSIRLMHQWVVYRVLKTILLKTPRLDERPPFMQRTVPREWIDDQYRNNVEAMIEMTAQAGRRLMLTTLPVNLRYDYRRDRDLQNLRPKEDDFIRRGEKLLGEKKYYEALGELTHSNNPNLAARLIGEALEGLGKYELAREAYKLYITNLSVCRTPPAYNQFLRQVATEHRLPLADLERAVDQAGPHGIADPRLFHDSCHLRWFGYYLAAAEIYRAIRDAGLLPSALGRLRQPPPMAEIVNRYDWKDLADLERGFDLSGPDQTDAITATPDAITRAH